eukprot:253225-Rhodomonas_salina.2
MRFVSPPTSLLPPRCQRMPLLTWRTMQGDAAPTWNMMLRRSHDAHQRRLSSAVIAEHADLRAWSHRARAQKQRCHSGSIRRCAVSGAKNGDSA